MYKMYLKQQQKKKIQKTLHYCCYNVMLLMTFVAKNIYEEYEVASENVIYLSHK